MISSGSVSITATAVDSVAREYHPNRPQLHHNNHHNRTHHVTGFASLPLRHNFASIQELASDIVVLDESHARAMSTSTFIEPFMKGPNNTILQPAEFLRPLPKPAPRYNGVNGNSFNGAGKPKKFTTDSETPVNLAQPKENPSDHQTSYSMYNSSRLYPSAHAPPFTHYPPPPSIQTGPYGALYPPNPYTPILQRDVRSTHLLPLQQYPNSNNSVPATSSSTPVVRSSITVSVSPATAEEKKPFKVPSGKEGSLKHRILTRPEANRPQKRNQKAPLSLPPPQPPSVPPVIFPANETNGVNGIATPELITIANMSPNFTKGSLIRLANGAIKKIEDLQTEDFIISAERSTTVRVDPSTVVRIQENVPRRGSATLSLSYGELRHKVDFQTAVEHPYFIFGRGWCSCCPQKTFQRYGLQCFQLLVGDICISLSPRNDGKLKKPTTKFDEEEQKRKVERVMKKCKALLKQNDLKSNLKTINGNIDKACSKRKSDNDDNNNTTDDGLIGRKKRRWSAPDQLSDGYQSSNSSLSPLSSPLSSGSSFSVILSPIKPLIDNYTKINDK